MTPAQHDTLARIISAIGEEDFVATAAHAIRRMMGFNLATAILYRHDDAKLLFDNFADVGGSEGVQNYVRYTHRINPILSGSGGAGVFRARDFALTKIDSDLADYLIPTRDEELGFRTVGWPEKLEEVGLYVNAHGGVVELSFYRPRATRAFHRLAQLEDMRAPLAAAFDKHAALMRRLPSFVAEALSARETQVADLLLAGCSSEAIAMRLGIGRFTVKDHRKSIFRKLGVGSLAEFFALARGASH